MVSEDGSVLGRRDRKRLATHQALRSAALRLVAERGLHDVTVEEIADAADVAVRTFFNHFSSKEDALVGIDSERAEELSSAVSQRPAGEAALDSLRAVLTAYAMEAVASSDDWALRMDIIKASPELLPRLLSSVSALERTLVEAIQARETSGDGRGLYAELVVSVAMAAVRTSIARWRQEQGTRSLAETLGQAFDLIASGLPEPRPTRATAKPGLRRPAPPGGAAPTARLPAVAAISLSEHGR